MEERRMNRKLRRVVAVSVIAIGISGCGSDSGTDTNADSGERIEVTARSFHFEADEIHVRAGQDVKIRLTSRGAHHDFVIDELNFELMADQGERAEATLSAPPEGRYTFYCSVPGHRDAGMEGTLIVEP